MDLKARCRKVAPLAGAWIEISLFAILLPVLVGSLPSRERGLKYLLIPHLVRNLCVAPLAGAWIEIIYMLK